MGKEGKQRNKSHKGGAKLGRRSRFREGAAMKSVQAQSGARALAATREHRMSIGKNLREARIREVLAAKRNQREHGPPKVICVLAISDLANTEKLLQDLVSAADENPPAKSAMEVEAKPGPSLADPAPFTFLSMQHKLRASFVTPKRSDLMACLEACKVADAAVLVTSTDQPGVLDDTAKYTLAMFRAQGMPPSCLVVQGPDWTAAGMSAKSAAKKASQAVLDAYVKDSKVMLVDGAGDCKEVLRHLAGAKEHTPVWRSARPYLLTENIDFVPDATPDTGTLLITGYVRGAAMSADQLVHVPGLGDFQMKQVVGPEEPCPYQRRGSGGEGMEAEGGGAGAVLLSEPSEGQEDLARINAVNPLEGEQTWPTEQEMEEADRARTEEKAKLRLRVPKGTSSYQSSWMNLDEVSDDDELDYSDGDDDDDEECPEGVLEIKAPGPEDTGMEGGDADIDSSDGEEEEELADPLEDEDAAKMAALMERERERRMEERAAREDAEFPDEMDTPLDVPARQRFAKFRGLKSFRSTPWDPKEELPVAYSRIFAFSNFKQAQKKVLKEARQDRLDSLDPGRYVCVHIAAVPSASASALMQSLSGSLAARPLVVSALLRHEGRLSVLNISAQKSSLCTQVLKSKEQFVWSVGFRKFTGRPVFSTDSNNADKHKYERFLHPGPPSVASVYATITFPPAPVLVFKPRLGAEPLPVGVPLSPQAVPDLELAFTGNLRSADPDRIVLKRIILTGVPHKVHKRKALVQFMFHNPEDVRYFKPLELWTKYGRRGRIKESVGIHGRMKCIFDGVVQQRDTVCVNLYKRVFPPWPEEED